jgi:ketosteroid isomerase-like protein
MPGDNIALVRAGIEEFARTGVPSEEFLHPDFELVQASSIVDTAGVFRGPNALRDSLRELSESFEDFSLEAEDYREAPGGEVVALIRARGRGRGSGVEIDNRIAHVWKLRDGKAERLVVYEEPDEAFAAVGL